MRSPRLALDPDQLHVDSFVADGPAQLIALPTIHDTVLRPTEAISCYRTDCGTCGGTDCWA
jgi:hypothetical protein